VKITLDTNVLLRTHQKAFGPARRLLNKIKDQGHELVLSAAILYELEEVMNDPRIRRLMQLTDGEVADYIGALCEMCTLVDIGTPLPSSSQEIDWTIVTTAIAGEVDVICSCDRALHDANLERVYRRARIEVVTDIELLKRL
jgi:putative PIN family toxin of toxin-antitoxin system